MPQAQVIPELAYPDVATAVEWLGKTFGFSVRLRIGNHRVQLEVGNGAVILRTGAPSSSTSSDHSVMVRVEKVDEHYAKAVLQVRRMRPNPSIERTCSGGVRPPTHAAHVESQRLGKS